MQSDIPFGKILRPTPEEFADFAGYLDKVEKANPLMGVFKVIPPKKWKPAKINYETDINNLIVSHPIEQNVYGKGGIYELLLIQKKSMRVSDYKKKVDHFDHLTDGKSIEDVEEMFWRNVAFSPPLYGADIKGSLFDEGVQWDLKNLPGMLSDGLRKKISGVNEPYLYFGSWKTMFAWHKEDMDLYSINYLHTGKPKFWYCLPREEGPRFEAFAKQLFPEAFGKCKEYLRHKTILISPQILKQKIPDLKINRMIQNPGEFVITVGGSYHAGFNWGFNLAEAVNFALPKWLDLLPNAQACRCMSDSVKIDKAEFMKNLGANYLKKKTGSGPAIKKLEDMETEDDEEKINEKSSSSTKATRRSSENTYSTPNSRKNSENNIKIEEPKAIKRESPSRGTKKSKVQLNHPLLKRKQAYEPRALKEKRQAKEAEHDANNKLLKGSKKIKKVSVCTRSGSATGSRKASTESLIVVDDKSLKKIKKLVKAGESEDIHVENWLQCDDCGKWRKITDGKKPCGRSCKIKPN